MTIVSCGDSRFYCATAGVSMTSCQALLAFEHCIQYMRCSDLIQQASFTTGIISSCIRMVAEFFFFVMWTEASVHIEDLHVVKNKISR